MPSPPQLAPGAVFARDFRVIAPLGQGGMGVVYRTEQLSTGRPRALKLLLAAAAADPALLRRFEQEARVGALIQSDHIVEVVAAGVDDETRLPWLAMELLDGRDLGALVRERGPLPQALAGQVLGQLLSALAAAHRAGVVHRDLKPENLFLATPRDEGSPPLLKVLDFGIAKVLGASTLGLTAPMGTPLWMAPEQTDLNAAIRPAADVWALGLLAFYLHTGHSYWRTAGDPAGSPAQLMRELLLDPLPPASARASFYGAAARLPAGFDAWFARCVVRDPADRFASAAEAQEAFAQRPSAPSHVASPSTLSQPTPTPLFSATSPPLSPSLSGPTPCTPPSPLAATAEAPAAGPSPTAPQSILAAIQPTWQTPQHPPQKVHAGSSPSPITGPAVSLPQAPPQPSAQPRTSLAVLSAVLLLGMMWASGMYTYRSLWLPGAAASATASAPPTPTLITSTPPSTFPTPLKVTLVSDARLGTVMAQFPAAAAWIGSGDFEQERPRHLVSLPSFAIDVSEVLVAHYRLCIEAGACAPPGVRGNFCNWGKLERQGHPMNCVDWAEAQAFCKWAGKRLPSEEEWEYAARGPEERPYPWGSTPPDAGVCWNHPERLSGPGPGTCLGGNSTRDITPQGIVDMGGNVSEWTANLFCPYDNPGCPQSLRTVRGASFAQGTPIPARGVYRMGMPADARSHMGVGFRCAR